MRLAPERVKARALELGFIACGVTDLAPSARGDALDRWLANGYAGTMRYMHRQAARRKAPQRIAPAARSVVVVLDNYYSADRPSDARAPRIARYARGTDYHRATVRRLELLAEYLREHGAGFTRCFADAGPVPERELAQRAGLGWIGKNTMLIRSDAGSFFFIGSVCTDLPLEPDLPYEMDRCGSCTRCLDACPTNALAEPRVLDATRCISYLTIEQKGPIPAGLTGRLSGWAFGCDICNDVCPWNERFATETGVAEFRPRIAASELDPDIFERMDESEFAERFGDTPLERAGLAGMRRNVRAALESVASTPVIRAAEPTDAQRLAEFGARTFVETYAADMPGVNVDGYVAQNYGERQQAAELADPRNSCLLVELGGALAGFALLRDGCAPPVALPSRTSPALPSPAWPSPGPALAPGAPVQLARFYVDRPWHGRGIAQALMRATVEHAAARGGALLWLTVWQQNARAIAFYGKSSFSIAGSVKFRIGDEEQDDHLMVRHLPAGPAPAASSSA
ncbi:MAG TPA: tRNA epoxyqueuosine(34) reductase QueG [Gemmatimonadales bacterium]|nr:tRNA epoxyqueuosine(34) reductase QueG [Gemmatimonadales bacterium]